MLERSRALLRMIELLAAGCRASDVMGLPPNRKFGATFPELLKKIAKRGIVCPQIMCCSKLRDDPLGFIGPGCAKLLPRQRARQHGDEDITLATGQLIER